jgi:hypothetical protein
MTVSEIQTRAEMFTRRLPSRLGARIVDGTSAAGGGVLPGHEIPTKLVEIECDERGVARKLRLCRPAVVVRREKGKISIDLRTVLECEEEPLITMLSGVL